MSSSVFAFLKRKNLTDTKTVNRLLVSAFVIANGIIVKKNSLIKGLIITTNEELYPLFQELMIAVGTDYRDGISMEDLIRMFEFVISPADRIVTGAVYTPGNIRRKIISSCIEGLDICKLSAVRVADIACGCGAFLIDVAVYIKTHTNLTYEQIFENNIYGIDIQAYSVERTKILLSLLAILKGEDSNFQFNILQADTLDFNTDVWNQTYNNLDIVVGNPPYVCSRNVSDLSRQKMINYSVCRTGHPDLYIPFFQIASEMLVDGGKLGFITMNSFIRSINGRGVREYLSESRYDIRIIDFRGYQVFLGKNTYTCIFYLTKSKNTDYIQYTVNCNGNLDEPISYTRVPYCKLNNKNGWSLNDYEKSSLIEGVGNPITKLCKFRHGIATLCNKVYIFTPCAEDSLYYYIESDKIRYSIEKNICKDIVNSNKLNSDVDFDSLIQKVIFPYSVGEDGVITVIEEKRMKEQYPRAYCYLQSKRHVLLTRDKGKASEYPIWYAFGRKQSLSMPRYKLFYSKIANRPLRCVLRDAPDLLLYNGIAFVSDDCEVLKILKRIMESNLFWDYIKKNAKPYSSGYYSVSGVDIKKFGIPDFTREDIDHLLSLSDKFEINEWLRKFYEYL